MDDKQPWPQLFYLLCGRYRDPSRVRPSPLDWVRRCFGRPFTKRLLTPPSLPTPLGFCKMDWTCSILWSLLWCTVVQNTLLNRNRSVFSLLFTQNLYVMTTVGKLKSDLLCFSTNFMIDNYKTRSWTYIKNFTNSCNVVSWVNLHRTTKLLILYWTSRELFKFQANTCT